MAEASCPICGGRFVKRHSRQRYCTPEHSAQARAARSKRTRSRYGPQHEQLRKRIAREVAAGLATCARCGGPIAPGEAFDLDHADNGEGWLGASHVRCNRATNRRRPRPAPFPVLELDDPAGGTFWGPPDPDGYQRRWSRVWFEWRNPQ
ncbi:MAG TPA: hypothetical protein VMK83_00390 [Gaiellaceae bacterium]|nr:hypothetical protein [Gaiellaceae bacterium]